MKKLHPTTALGAVFILSALVCILVHQEISALVLLVLAFFGATREVSIFTSKFQFSVVTISAILLGAILDSPFDHFPFITLSVFIGAFSSVIRIAFFRIFSYTGYVWTEIVLVVIALALYGLGAYTQTWDWKMYSFPAAILIFALSFGINTMYDGFQLLTGSRLGYQIKLGQPAKDFSLPDQNGNMVNLSDFKNERTVLLVFVRGDWCPMCHMMLRTYDKRKEEFQQKNIMLLAVGPDPVGVNKAMVEKLGVDFRVLSDEGQRTARVYGVQIQDYKNNFAPKQPDGIPLPASFLVDANQIVRYVSSPARVGEYLNPSLVFDALSKIN